MNDLPVFLTSGAFFLLGGVLMLLRSRKMPSALVARYRRSGQFCLVVAALDAAVVVAILLGAGTPHS